MHYPEEKDNANEVWPPPISLDTIVGPASPKENRFPAIFKKCVLGLTLGVFCGPVISIFTFVVRVLFARYGYDLHPYIYYGAPFTGLIISSLVFLRHKYAAIGFAFGAVSLSLLIAVLLTIIDGLNTLD